MAEKRLAAAVGALFDEREDLSIEARVPTVEAMSLLKGSEAGVVRKELDLLLSVKTRDAAALARLSLFGSRNGEVSASVALNFASTAAEETPGDLESAMYLIAALAEVGEYTNALQQLETTAAVHPDWGTGATANSWRGSLAYNLSDFAAAAAAYSRTVSTDPAPINYLRLGDSLRQMEQNAEARRCYRKALRRDPQLDDALYGYLALALPLDSWLGWVIDRILETRHRKGRLASALLRVSAARRLARLLLSIPHRRAPERIDVRLALGVIALLDVDLKRAESLLVPFTKTAPSDPLALGLATLVSIYSERTPEAVLRAKQLRLLNWRSPEDKGGDQLLSGCFWRLASLQPRLARLVSRESYEAVFNVWPRTTEPVPETGQEPGTLSITFATQATAPAAASAFRTGESQQEEIELTVKGSTPDGLRGARIAVYGRPEAINVRWIAGDPLILRGVRLGLAYMRVAIEDQHDSDLWLDVAPTVRRGVDIREALSRLLRWA